MITIEQIVHATKCSLIGLTKHYKSLVEACEKYEINNIKREAAFIANCVHETGGFRDFVENLNYSEQGLLKTFKTRVNAFEAKELARKPELIANHVYGGRFGNNKTGDGWKYRGRGVFQTTFKDNYSLLSKALKYDFVENPDTVALPPYAALSAGFYWFSHHLSQYADHGDILSITKIINGGLNGYEDRKKYYSELLAVCSSNNY